MAQQVTITLTASFGSLGQRLVKLTPESASIPIGRSSKSASKNILGAANNAWFDSPVMSRKHAEMYFKFDSDKATVTLRDIGSMHGTCLNGRKLSENEEAQVNDGDVVVFGAEVKRGPEVFLACSFQVGLQFSPFHSSNSYCSPEMDDSSEAGISDVDTDEREPVSSEDEISIESPAQCQKVFESSQAIDLTEDDSPAPAPSSDIVDLTDEPAPAVETISEPNPGGNLPSYAIELSDSDDQSEMEDLYDSEGSENSDNSDEPENFPEFDDEIAIDSASEDMVLGDEDSELDDDDLPTDLRESARSAALVGELEEVMDEDDESDFGLSDAGAEGLRALFEDEFPTSPGYSTTCPTLDVATSTIIPSKNFLNSFSSAASSADDICSAPLTFTGAAEALLYKKPNGEILPARQPSPSDAAMVKTAPVKPNQQNTTHFQGYGASQLPQILGDKTGKHAFFEAREKNKVDASLREEKVQMIAQNPAPHLKPVFSEADASTIIAPPTAASHSLIVPTSLEALSSVVPPPAAATQSPIVTSKWTAEDIKNPIYENQTQFCKAASKSFSLLSRVPVVHRSQFQRATSPDYDMTSAHQFNESKNRSIRSRLSIHDIIENSAREQSIPQTETRAGGKRKADEISDIQDEVRAWASSAVAQVKSKTPIQGTVLASSSTVESRPTKRLKKFMEAAAYVAVGGVTVGAGLFFSLVATAPNFS